MKIAFLSYYSGKIFRGAEKYVHELANGLVKLGHDVSVYQSGDKTIGNYYQIKPYNAKENIPKEMVNYDCVIPVNGKFQAINASLWAKFNHKKIIIAGQSGLGLDDKINLLVFPDIFVSLSEYQKQWAGRVNPFVKIKKIPNGVNLQEFNPNTRPFLKKTNQKTILSVGALTKAKRHDLLIQAVSKIPNSKLIIVGTGDEKNFLHALGKKLIPGRLQILSLSYEDMPGIYTSADVFAFPSVPWESFGIVLLEAMASGLPIVTTDDPIRREIVGPAGIFVKPENIDEFVAALSTAIHKKWANVAVNQASGYSWDIVAKKYSEVIKDICQKSH